MEYYNFPQCCGIKILAKFGHTEFSSHPINHTPEEVNNYLKKEIDYTKKITKQAILMATLNDSQLNVLKDVFIENDFEISNSFYHPNHNTNIYILTRKMFNKEDYGKNN